MREDPLAFLSLVRVLETALGHKTSHALLDPFPLVTLQNGQPEIISIQRAGKIIAEHVGLGDLTFIIAVTTQKPNVAGHVELRYGTSEVFVEISRDICAHKDAVLATLCHEVSHKFLHAHAIRHGTTQIEQEFLTDVAAVYLGFGKIMLNGCECQSSHTETVGGRSRIITETLRTGYISRDCFAFVYRLVCEMRRIPAHLFLAGLSQPAKEAVLACEQLYGGWFRTQYHTPSGVEILLKDLADYLLDIKHHVADCELGLRRADQSIVKLRAQIRESHKSLLQAEKKIEALRHPLNNPALRYLECLETEQSVAHLGFLAEKQIGECRPDLDKVSALARGTSRETQTTGEVVECPLDGTRLRVPTGRRRLLVTCSRCKYKFVANTGELDVPTTSTPQKQQSRIAKSLKAVFGRGGS